MLLENGKQHSGLETQIVHMTGRLSSLKDIWTTMMYGFPIFRNVVKCL